jgi:7-keto-8-aminopelargonate synthetase-like enzyme/CRP-like cAMP-binding protein
LSSHALSSDDPTVLASRKDSILNDARVPRSESLSGSVLDYVRPAGSDLLARTRPFDQWRQGRLDDGVWPFSRVLHAAPGTATRVFDEAGRGGDGENFASQDYLGLAGHPAVIAAAKAALADFGPHSAGSPILAGNTRISQQLEREIGEVLQMEHVLLFPTGWGAGFGSISGLVRADDWVVMDQLSHACLQQGANAATRNISRFKHNDVTAAARALADIRSRDTEHGILVVTEGIFSMDSDVPDLVALQQACREHGATLLVDVAHDFGALGPDGGGSLASQKLLGKVDLVVGAFSKTFASNGGFLATRHSSVRQYLKVMAGTHTFSNAISPVQAAVVLASLQIVRSPEGQELRDRLLRNSNALRSELERRGVRCLGEASAVVPAMVGAEAEARVTVSLLNKRGMFVNLAEFPAVALGAARLRMQVMAGHVEDQMRRAGQAVGDAMAEAREMLADRKQQAPSRIRLSGSTPEFAPASFSIAGLGPQDLTRLVAVSRPHTVADEAVILYEGERSSGIFFIREGTVRIITEHMGAKVEIAQLGPGDVLGEVSALDGQGATASAIAVGEVKLIELDEKAIENLTRSEPILAFRLMRAVASVLAGRLRGMSPAFVGTLAARGGD